MNSKDKVEGKKIINPEVVELLRKTIPEVYLEAVLCTRYHENKVMKPVIMDNFIEEIDKHDKEQHHMKKKAPSKPKPEQPLPRNQPTLFQFSAKKQSK